MFEERIRTCGRRLFGLCLKLCGERQDAEDLYQDTWLRAYAAYARYDPQKPFEGWLTRICVNLYRDRLRRRAVSRLFNGFSSNEEKDRALESVPAQEYPEEDARLRSAVDELPEKLRMAVILYYFYGLEINGTAEALGVPPGTVKSRLSKARALLKERLQDEELF